MKQLTLSQVVGQASDQTWSQVFVLPSLPAQKSFVLSKRHPVMAVVALTHTNLSGEGAAEVGGEVIRQFSQVFEEMDELGRDLEQLYFKSLQELGRNWPTQSLELIVGVFRDDRITLMSLGGGRAALSRDGKIGLVHSGKSGEVSIIQGELKGEDRLLIGTNGLVGEMSHTLIKEVLTYPTPIEASEELAPLIRSQADSNSVAGVIVHSRETSGNNDELKQTAYQTNNAEPKIYLSGRKPKKVTISVGIILLVLLGASIFLGWRQRQATYWRETFEQYASGVSESLEQAEKLSELNPIGARQALSQAEIFIEEGLIALEDNQNYLQELIALRAEYQIRSQEILGINPLDSADVWHDLSLVRDNLFGTRITLSSGSLVVLDGQRPLLASINTNSKQYEITGGDLLRTGKALSVSGSRAVVLTNEGVVEASLAQKTTAMLIDREAVWKSPSLVEIYGGNVYLLDPVADELWRYPGLTRGVGARQRWFSAGVEPDLSSAVDMVIDGDIWILNKDGKILRFRRGSQVNFSVTGLDEPIKEAVSIWTNEQASELYILDRGNNRVVVIDKDGAYTSQYRWDGLSAADDLVVVEEMNMILVLIGNTIYSIGL